MVIWDIDEFGAVVFGDHELQKEDKSGLVDWFCRDWFTKGRGGVESEEDISW